MEIDHECMPLHHSKFHKAYQVSIDIGAGLSGEIKIWMCIIDFVSSSKYADGTTLGIFGSCIQLHN